MISIIVETCVSLFDSILCVYFITRYSKRNIKGNKLFFPAILLIFITTLIGDFVSPGFNMVITTALWLLTAVYALLICKGQYITAIMSTCIWKVSYILLSSFLHQVLSVTIADYADTLQGSTDISRYILLLLHKIFLLAIIRFILVSLKADGSVGITNGLLMLFVSLITVLGMGTAMKVLISDSSGQSETPMFIITITFVIINLSVYFLIYQIQKLQKDRYEMEFLKQKLSYETKRYNDASVVWNEIRKAQHDFKQHLTVLKCQIEDNDIDGCKKYIDTLLPNIYRSQELIKSDNSIIDYLINSKLSALDDVQVTIAGSVTGLSDIKETDLACLIGNILDNAVEGIKNVTDKRIELTFHNQNSNRVIICKNTIRQSVLSTNKNLNSTKKNSLQHGYGHLIIEKIVDDYNGMLDYFEENNMFGVQVILPEPM